MAISAKVGAFNTGTGAVSTTVAVTSVGFQPKVLIFWWTGRTESTNAVGRRSVDLGVGTAISSIERWANSFYSLDAAATSDTSRRSDNTQCITTIDNAGALTGALDFQSMDSDGFTLIVDDVMPFNMRVHYMALGGSDLTNYAASFYTGPTVTGNFDITALSFQPDFLFTVSTSRLVDPPAGATDGAFAVGAAVSSSQQAVFSAIDDENNVTMNTNKYCYFGELFAAIPLAGDISLIVRDSFVSFLSNGFRLNRVEGTYALRVQYLALKGGSYRVDSLLTRTDGNDIVESGFGFSPRAAMFFGHMAAQSTVDTTQDGMQFSIGAFSSITDRGAQCHSDADAVADSIITTAVAYDEVYVSVDSAATPAIVALMDVKSVDADGFTCVMDNVDAAAAFVPYWAIGDTPSGANWGPLLGLQNNRLVQVQN